MRALGTLAIALSFAGATCYASQRYSGKLMDADCYNSNKVASQESDHKTYHSIAKTCAATASSTSFAVRITGSPYGADVGNTIKLDNAGNAQAMAELKDGTLKPGAHGNVRVRVSGQLMGEVLKNASVKPGA